MDNESLWGHLLLLMQSNSKESVEYILQALWRTRNTGLDSADRAIIREMLQLHNDSDLDPLLVCLRILTRRCVYGNYSKDEFHKLFPQQVPPELQRLLTLLLHKFQQEWTQDALKDQVSLPRLKAMTWNMANQNGEDKDHVAVINLKEWKLKMKENKRKKYHHHNHNYDNMMERDGKMPFKMATI
ncbi:hypothetical protein ACLOJK_039858 [Asimina triloba]